MNPQPGIEEIAEKILVGKRIITSLSDDKTTALWRSFMPHRKQIKSTKNNNLYSVQLYHANYFTAFDAAHTFQKWSAVEVTDVSAIPQDMEVLMIPAGLYAVFPYKGLSTDPSIFNFIFREWIPFSDYVLDHRPHFEVMGEKYRNNDPLSEEDIFIPLKRL